MAGTSTATISIYNYPKGVDNTQRFQIVRGTIAISQGTYPSGGYPLNWAAEQIKALPGTLPVEVDVNSVAGVYSPPLSPPMNTAPSGYIYLVDSSTGNLHIMQAPGSLGPLVELTSTVPQGVYEDIIQFTAFFYRNN